jgi:predicted permease
VSTNLVIAIISIVVNAVTIPIGMYLINLGQAKDRAKLSAETVVDAKGDVTVDPSKDAKADKTAELLVHGSSNAGKNKNGNLQALLNALKQPVCWAPLLAIILVLLGVHVPDQVAPTFDLIAKANSGVAVLAAGLALSTVKFSLGWETIWNTFFRLILTPAVFLGVGLLCGMGGDIDKISMLVMAVALPPAFSGIIISSRYNIYVKEGASTTAVSTVVFAATCLLWIWLVPFCVH